MGFIQGVKRQWKMRQMQDPTGVLRLPTGYRVMSLWKFVANLAMIAFGLLLTATMWTLSLFFDIHGPYTLWLSIFGIILVVTGITAYVAMIKCDEQDYDRYEKSEFGNKKQH